MSQTVVYVGSANSPWQKSFEHFGEGSEDIELIHQPNTKKALKYFRKNPDVSVLAAFICKDTLEDFCKLSDSIRNVMHNQSVRLIACAEDEGIAGTEMVERFGVSSVIHAGKDRENRLKTQLSAELNTHALLVRTQSKHDAETSLLSAIARFSRLEMKLSECLSELANSTGILTGAALVNVIMVRRDGILRRSSVSYVADGIDAKTWLKENHSPDNPKLHQVVEEARLQLVIQPDDPELIAATDSLGHEISGRFIFPLRSFGRTMCLVECWLPADSLSMVSVDLVRLIEKSSEQFSLLFERNQADKQLKRQYKRLKFTLDELNTTQNALYHSEKLASIGQLAAGIAHEINNPVAYVMGNFNPLNDYVGNMSQMLELHSKFVSVIDQADVSIGSELREEIDQLGADLDIDYIMEDVRALVHESKNGLERVREIILNLNQFARQDTLQTAPTNINEDIESTLRLLHSDIKDGVSIEREFSDMPPVNCQAGLIKQVVLNLIKNSIQAMNGKGSVKISTGVEDGYAVILIRDTGDGIPEEALSKIFDPFFTTKDVGEGTGLGLSLSHGIIERHEGELSVTETGVDGTEFRLALPLNGAQGGDLPLAA